MFVHACKLGLEGIVFKRRDSPYASGRSLHWIKSKNPHAPGAVQREAQEDRGKWPSARGSSTHRLRVRRTASQLGDVEAIAPPAA